MALPPADPLPPNSRLSPSAGERKPVHLGYVFRTYSWRESLFTELARLVEEGKLFDGLVIDLTQTGYSLPLEVLVKFNTYAKRLLKSNGTLLLVKSDGSISLARDDAGGGLTLTVFDSPFGIFTRHPGLSEYICATVPGIDRRRLAGGGSTLANHILQTSTPVLTKVGRETKDAFEVPPPHNWLLQVIDDYSTVESIAQVLEKQNGILPEATLRLLQELESDGIIYPIFARIQFLANCYHNQKPFRLGRYLVAIGILTANQLQELLELQQEEGWGRTHRTFLGLLSVRQGYLNTRELEVLLHDQYLYGGYHQSPRGESPAGMDMNVEIVRNSMIGSLGAIDPHGLLQSLSTAQKTGLLTVEHRDRALIVAFEGGKPEKARMGKLSGYAALTEFLVTWTEGIFVFRDKATSTELDDSSRVFQLLDRVLIDSALFQDQVNQILSGLPNGRNSILERVWNFGQLWADVSKRDLVYCDHCPVTDEDKSHIVDLVKLVDGLTILDEVMAAFDRWPSYMVIKSFQLLLDHKLISIQQTSLFRPLTIFQRIAASLGDTLGQEKNRSLIESSLHYVLGNSPEHQRFCVDDQGRVSINLAQMKRSGTPVSTALLEMRRWMEAYLAGCRREMDPQVVNTRVAQIVHKLS